MTPLPNDTVSMIASARSGTMSRHCACSGCEALAATMRPRGAPFVVWMNSVPSTTVPVACPSAPTVTTVLSILPVARNRSKSTSHRSFDFVSIQ